MWNALTRMMAGTCLLLIVWSVASLTRANDVDGVVGGQVFIVLGCKQPCSELGFKFYECAHFKPQGFEAQDPCQKDQCLEDLLFYAACAEVKGTEPSTCEVKGDPNALAARQNLYKAVNLNCGEPPVFLYAPVPGYPTGPCDFPAIGNLGRCFIPPCAAGMPFSTASKFGRVVCN